MAGSSPAGPTKCYSLGYDVENRRPLRFSISDYVVRGGLAQLGERLPCTQEVRGSNPLASTTLGDAFSALRGSAFSLGIPWLLQPSPIASGDGILHFNATTSKREPVTF